MKPCTRRLIASVLCAAVILAALLSSLFIVCAIDHDCTGADCAICACIKAAQQQLKKLGGANGKAAQAAAVLLWYAAVCRIFAQNKQKLSPVNAKVRMNN